MTTLVVGASGFLGRALVLSLPHEDGLVATYCDDLAFPNWLRLRGRDDVRPLRVDLTDRDAAAQLSLRAGDVDTCYWLAAHVDTRGTLASPRLDVELSLLPLLNVLPSLRCRRLVFVSSGAVYEGHTGPVGPDVPLIPTLPYAIAKLAAERYVAHAARVGSADSYVNVRSFGAYGPGEPHWKLTTRLIRECVLDGKSSFTLQGDGTNLLDPLYIDDAAQALVGLAAGPLLNATVDLAGGCPVTTRQWAEAVLATLDSPAVVQTTGETAEHLLCWSAAGGQPSGLARAEGWRRTLEALR